MSRLKPIYLKRGSRGADVSALQQQLNKAGLLGEPLPGRGKTGHGVFGPRTELKVVQFQKKHFPSKKDHDGIVGPKTRKKLNEVIAKRNKSGSPSRSATCSTSIHIGKFATALVAGNWLPNLSDDVSDQNALAMAKKLFEHFYKTNPKFKQAIYDAAKEELTKQSQRQSKPTQVIEKTSKGTDGLADETNSGAALADNAIVKAAADATKEFGKQYLEMCTAPGIFYNRNKNELHIIGAGIGIIGLSALWQIRSDDLSGTIGSLAEYKRDATSFKIGDVEHTVGGNIKMSTFLPSKQKIKINAELDFIRKSNQVITHELSLKGVVNTHKKEARLGGSFDYGFSFKEKSKYTLGLKVDAKAGAMYEYLPPSFPDSDSEELESRKFDLYGKMKVQSNNNLHFELEFRDTVTNRTEKRKTFLLKVKTEF